ncbi:MAG: HK97 family phage prohead protease [Ignavibacteria bacterium]|nr:HK97 family phage prohead protease [Ignavibacteria bacterium]
MENKLGSQYFRYKEINDASRSITHYISTPQVDSYGDIMKQEGMDDSKFKYVLWQHSLGMSFFSDIVPKPSDLIIGKSDWRRIDEIGVKAKTDFYDTTLGRDVYNFNKSGGLKYWSIGWKEKEEPVVEKRDNKKVKIYNKWFLYEYSSVLYPANEGAANIELMTEMKNDAKDELFKKSIDDYLAFDKIKTFITGNINDTMKQEIIDELKKNMTDENEYIKKEAFEELKKEHQKLYDLVNNSYIQKQKREVNLKKLDDLVDNILKNKLK